ncbi:TPA: hypothetical protein ACK3RK_007474 [Burkholderia cepacia]
MSKTLSYSALTMRAERMIRQLIPKSHDEARGALAMWDDLVTEMLAFNRADYQTDRARLEALIDGDRAPVSQP